jgi:hypothetical protein
MLKLAQKVVLSLTSPPAQFSTKNSLLA